MRLTVIAMSSVLVAMFHCEAAFAAEAWPNVVCIVADELGYYEPGFNGGRTIQTPNLDRLAAEGMRFTNLFAGSSVCAPTRCCLMTGKHSGHSSIRVNGGGTPLRADEPTIASMLKPLDYATGGFGKWGCGGRDSTGVPEMHGFDVFFGYYDQFHAHTYCPLVIRGGDTDTNAAIAGALLGAVHGRDAIPSTWQRALLSCRPLPQLTDGASSADAVLAGGCSGLGGTITCGWRWPTRGLMSPSLSRTRASSGGFIGPPPVRGTIRGVSL